MVLITASYTCVFTKINYQVVLGHELESAMGQLYFAFKRTPPLTGPNDPIYWSKHDKLHQSPSLGNYSIPPLAVRGKGPGSRKSKNRYPEAHRIGKKEKGSRSKRLHDRIKVDVQYNPGKHTREYIWNSREEIFTVPAPSQRQRTVPTLGYRRLPTGVYHTFTTFGGTPSATTVTTSTPAQRQAAVEAQFPVVSEYNYFSSPFRILVIARLVDAQFYGASRSPNKMVVMHPKLPQISAPQRDMN